ncbi:MAG: hypothetical protein PHQ35_08055 [Phycisphaerae bacterium]|nr:hypothetical protein [Phycisphaerae bacterium]MDD5380115.1 hypothetical protein [Phycisphaerae bacterium]
METKQKQGNSPPEIKKKSCFTSRIVWLAWVSILLLLLAAGLFLEVPWKITTLVFVFLFATTILPRAYRKWFWAGVGCTSAAVIIWIFLPEDNASWRSYTFEKDMATLKAKYAIPNGENAAVIYNALLESYDPNSFNDDSSDGEPDKFPMMEPWLSKEHPVISEWLEKHRTTIDTLLEASKIEQCRFPINPNITGMNSIMYRLASMKRWAHLLISAANNDVAEGRTKDGFDKYIAALQIGKHQCQQPTMVDSLVGVGIKDLSMSQLNRIIVESDTGEEYLSLTEQALEKIRQDWNTDLPRILEYEKLLTKNLWGLFYEVNSDGKTRLTRNFADTIKKQSPKDIQDELIALYWYQKLMKGQAILSWFYMPSTPERAGIIVDEVYGKCYAMAEPNYDWRKRPMGFSVFPIKLNYRHLIETQLSILEPVYYGVHDTYFRHIAQQRGALLTIALRRYKNKTGYWPGSLDDIRASAPEELFVDPINGSFFIYKLTDENFTFYSKGKNGIDDEGKRDRRGEEETGADDLLIWSGENF